MNTTIAEQIEINDRACIIATQSNESAIKFLEDAGIIKNRAGSASTSKHSTSVRGKKNPAHHNPVNFLKMNTTIEQQMKTNHEAYRIVSRSKESALKFLEDIGAVKKKIVPAASVYKPRKRSNAKK